ncbi:MAG: 3'-5' exonuclease domain-containing protein 2 [Kiritimatiellales bacterium]|nr:3'-5' exonuclease domain-containing protein 2 [Kiritimatiellales bacterium]
MTELHITKTEINALPMRQYEGPIHVIQSLEKVPSAVSKLRKEKVLGFDTETRPAFRKGESYLPSLIQLATAKEVYIFQLSHVKFPKELRAVLSDPGIIKAGVAINRDIQELKELKPFKAAGFIELADYAKKAHIKNMGLRGLAALLFGFRISKREQVSNWAREELTDSQIRYAATDAWLGREIYLRMEKDGILTSE